MSDLIIPPKGPFPTELAIVGEAPGRDEVTYQLPFVGAAGTLLNQMLVEVGVHPAAVYFTNVFKIRPEENEVERFFVPKKLGAPGVPPLRNGKYLPPSRLFWLDLLRSELALVRPRLILALGNTALWALTGKSGVQKLRGVFHETPFGPVPSTFHPASVLRVWAQRSIVVGDLFKAKQFLDGSLEAPDDGDTELYLDPSVDDFSRFREMVEAAPAIGLDVETSRGQITMVGVAVSPSCGFCIPFWDKETCISYWETEEEEFLAWQFVRWILAQPAKKVLHNGLYDIQYFAKTANDIQGLEDDTILAHHALQPELKKDLGGLGATYLNRSSWKELKHRRADELVKRDE